jgi:hypothetical protein
MSPRYLEDKQDALAIAERKNNRKVERSRPLQQYFFASEAVVWLVNRTADARI